MPHLVALAVGPLRARHRAAPHNPIPAPLSAPRPAQLVRCLTQDWPRAFGKLRKAMVAAQLDLLKALDWRLLLDYDSGAV